MHICCRYNSSIEGQKKKNQRKKSKKRSLERRKSESEAEEDMNNTPQVYINTFGAMAEHSTAAIRIAG